ncbi:IPIL1 protein, partial [Crotophaga sulcirostris]|nr:IPIL1 protein [Crotophaga sulcirostris]
AWSVHEDSITYRPIVFLQPPPGHSFCVETHPTEQLPAPAPTIRVVQQCMCLREQQLGDVFCFLHHTEDELPQTAQDLYRLHYLCTGQYFDVEKFTYWFHLLVRSAWLLLPQSCHFQLKVLPSPNSLRLQLTSTSEKNICIEMKFQVQ